VTGVAFFYRHGEQWLRDLLLYLSRLRWARTLISNFPLAWRVASRFIAGEQTKDAIVVAEQLNQQGMLATIDYLGESVTSSAEAEAACAEILTLFDQIQASGVQANVSVKLSQLGVNIDPTLARRNVLRLLERARQYNNRLRIDMEESALVDTTLAIYREFRQQGFDNVGVVIQAYLYRSADDIEQLIKEGAWVRLVKGAYKEASSVAYAAKVDTDAAFVRLTERMLSAEARAAGVYLAVASHDDAMLRATIEYAKHNQLPQNAFEFQMLYGIRRDRQRALVAQGYRMRVYIPYGNAWYPYFMRRLAERPANLWFFVSNLVRG
jgi:proline dehydrogenase